MEPISFFRQIEEKSLPEIDSAKKKRTGTGTGTGTETRKPESKPKPEKRNCGIRNFGGFSSISHKVSAGFFLCFVCDRSLHQQTTNQIRREMGCSDTWDRIYQPHAEAWGLLAAFLKICVATAVLTMFALNFQTALRDWRTIQQMEKETTFSESCALILEDSAAERGLSSTYFTGNRTDEHFFAELQTQRERLDQNLFYAIPEMKSIAQNEEERRTASLLEDWTKLLPGFRARVDDPSDPDLTLDDILRFYTTMNNVLIFSATHFEAQPSGPVMLAASDWNEILSLYDNLGRQRALGTSALVVGDSWGIVNHLDYIHRSGYAYEAEGGLLTFAKPDTRQAYVEYTELQTTVKLMEKRDFLETATVPSTLGTPASIFWDEFTFTLGDLYEVRNLVLSDLINARKDAADEAESRLITNSIGLAIGVIACLYILGEAIFSYVSLWRREQKVKELDSKFGGQGKGADWNA